jgi:hypothetical protein
VLITGTDQGSPWREVLSRPFPVALPQHKRCTQVELNRTSHAYAYSLAGSALRPLESLSKGPGLRLQACRVVQLPSP